MTDRHQDYTVTYVKDEKARVKMFWNEKDARAFAKAVDATRIHRTTIDILWECDEDEPGSDKPQPKSTRIEPTGYLS